MKVSDNNDPRRFDDLKSVGAILRAWSAGRMTDAEAKQLMELDDEDDLYDIAYDNWILPPDPVRRRDGEEPDAYARRMRKIIETVARIVRSETGTDLDVTEPKLDIDFALDHFLDAGWHDTLALQKSIKAQVSRIADPDRLRSVLNFINSEKEP